MRAERVTQSMWFSWKRRMGTFIGALTIIWLFVDPIIGLSLIPESITPYKSYVYSALLLFSAGVAFLIEFVSKLHRIGKITFVSMTIILTEEGTRHLVEVPQDMAVGVFVELFLTRRAKETTFQSRISRHSIYDKYLLIQRDRDFVEVAMDKTIAAVGLKNGDVCEIKGKIRTEEENIIFSVITPIILVIDRIRKYLREKYTRQ